MSDRVWLNRLGMVSLLVLFPWQVSKSVKFFGMARNDDVR